LDFNLYDAQKESVRSFQNFRKVVINKSRQIGISTTIAGYIAWLFWFHKDQDILVMATKLNTAANMIKKVKTILRHMPRWMKVMTMVKVDNVFSIELTNGSRIQAISRTADAGRSEALTLIVVDEAAHIQGFDDIWTSLKPTISTGGKCIIASTPLGVSNTFHDICKEAMNTKQKGTPGLNEFLYLEYPYNVRTEFTDEWFKKETKGLSSRAIRQEYLCSFLGSGDSV
jgi:phage FluMu gp28-like protein